MYTSHQLCAMLGITYRQLDHACRLGLIPDSATGSGSRRRFDQDTVDRLRVAAATLDATADFLYDRPTWPALANAVMCGPPPPDHGYIVLIGRTVSYWEEDSPAADLYRLARTGAVMVVHYDVRQPALAAA